MKQCVLMLAMLCIGLTVMAQRDEEKKGGFKLNNMYIGGGIALGAGFGNGGNGFTFGIQPEIGYSLTQWLDAGIPINLIYTTQRLEDPFTGSVYAKYRTFNYGSGLFLRAWIFQNINLTVQPEYNWIKATQIDVASGNKFSQTFKAESFLVGIGYGSRIVGQNLSYLNIMIDLAQNINSPYRDQLNRAQPLIRTGIGFYLGRRR